MLTKVGGLVITEMGAALLGLLTCVGIYSIPAGAATVAHSPNGEYAVASTGCSPGEVGTGDMTVTYYNFPVGGNDSDWYYSGTASGHSGQAFYQAAAGQPTVLSYQGWQPGTYTISVTWPGGGLPATAVTVPDCDGGGTSSVAYTTIASTPDGGGYWTAQANGTVTAHGDAQFYGDASALNLNGGIVSMSPTADGKGYYLLGSDGGVFTYGDAQFYGSTGSIHLNCAANGITPTADGNGYWFVACDGGIFAYGDAPFYGSMGGQHLNQPVVGMARDPGLNGQGNGYWLVAADGGIFSFNAPFYGSTGSIHLNKPIKAMLASADGGGYEFVASDGGVFTYGNAPFYGSAASTGATIVGMASTQGGYWLLGSDGNVYNFGSAPSL